MRLRIIVPGPPVPCARARVVSSSRRGGKKHAVTPAKTDAYLDHVAAHAMRVRALAGISGIAPNREGRFSVTIDVYPVREAGDIDNFAKSALDGLTRAHIWKDDRQVKRLVVNVWKASERPSMHLLVELLP